MSKQQHFGTTLLYYAFGQAHEEDNELGEYHCRGAVRQGSTNPIAEQQEAEHHRRDNKIRVRRRVLFIHAVHGHNDATLPRLIICKLWIQVYSPGELPSRSIIIPTQ